MVPGDLRAGEEGRILGFAVPRQSPYRQKLLSMGLTPGTGFIVLRVAPLGDPIEIRVRGFDLSLRRHEAAILRIERRPSRPTPSL